MTASNNTDMHYFIFNDIENEIMNVENEIMTFIISKNNIENEIMTFIISFSIMNVPVFIAVFIENDIMNDIHYFIFNKNSTTTHEFKEPKHSEIHNDGKRTYSTNKHFRKDIMIAI